MVNLFNNTKFYDECVPYRKDMCDKVSEMLMRANPKLSTNAKIMTNGDFVSLESFDACKEISTSRYKNVKTYQAGRYNNDISRFWKDTGTSLAYSVLEEYDSVSVKSTYEQQYETFYWSGCEYIDSLEYDEAYGILAPIWLDDIIPERFVVFKVNEPSYWNFITRENEATRDLDFVNDILNKCEIVKTFDLTENSGIGSYIRRYYNQEGFPEAPVTLTKEYLSFNGIDYNTGNFTSVNEHYDERFWKHDDNVIEFDEYITEGFERNGIIVANILNLEFLFDDEKKNDYEFTRYFGLYCNVLRDGTFSVVKQNLYQKRNNYDFDIFEFSECYDDNKEFIARNALGVNLPVTDVMPGQSLFEPDFAATSSVKGMFCIEDKYGQLHLVSRTNDLEQGVTDAYKLCEHETDLNAFNGFAVDIDSIDCVYENNATKSSVSCEVVSQVPQYTRLCLYKNNMLQGCIISDVASQYLTEGECDYDMFCGEGNPRDIAKSIACSFNNVFDLGIKAYYSESKVYFISMNSSPAYNEYEIRVEGPGLQAVEFINNGHFFGSNQYDHVKCRESLVESFKVGNYLPSRTDRKYVKIIAVVPDYDSAEVINGNQIVFGDDKYYDVLLDGEGVLVYRTNQTKIYKRFRPSFCRLSFFDVKDLEMSTYHAMTKYGDKTELNYELENTHVDRQVNVSSVSLENNVITISIDDPDCGETVITVTIDTDDTICLEDYTFSVKETDTGYSVTIDPVIMNVNAIAIEETNVIKDNFSFDTLSTTLNVPMLTYLLSEYDRCYENLNPDFMLKSKTQPWICNWVMKDGLDIREKPYRLNNNPVFGQYSFTPDMTYYQPNPVYYNQEWPYIMEEPVTSLPNINVEQQKIFSYIGCTVTDKNEFESRLKSTTENWFDVYFKRDHILVNPSSDSKFWSIPDYMHKYSTLGHGTSTTSAETFFRGAKIEFIMKSDWAEHIDNNLNNIKKKFGTDLNGYKFTAVCVPISIEDGSVIDENKLKVIRNDVFKTITMIIYVVKKYVDAIEYKFGINDNNELKCIDLGTINRFKLYNYNRNDNTSGPISVKGAGKVKAAFDNSGKAVITGEGTSFLNDFTIYDEETTDYAQEILMIRNFDNIGTSYSGSVVVIGAHIDEIISDTEMTATIINYSSDDIYTKVHNAIPGSTLYNGSSQLSADDLTYYSVNCDYDQFASNLGKNVFGAISYTVNTNQKNMVYEMVYLDEDGNERTLSSENGEYPFAMRFVKPLENAKYEYMSLLYDGEFIRQGILPSHAAPMYRHTGSFVPLKNNVLYFTDPYIEDAVKQNSFNEKKKAFFESSRHLHTCFDDTVPGFGMIKDLAFHRANEENSNVFKLSEGQRPVYPTSNRIAVGSRDVQVFNSSWDPWYFTKTLSNTLELDCHGTMSMKENKAFFGSKCLSVPEKFVFDTFTYSAPGNTDQGKDVTCAVKNNNGSIELLVNVEKILTDKLVNDLTPIFESYIDKVYSYGDTTTVSDDVEEYVRLNLLKLYQVSDVKVCIKSESCPGIEFDFSGLSMTAEQKKVNGLKLSNVMGVSAVQGNRFNKKIVLNTKTGTKYTIGLMLEIIKK